MNSFFFYSFTSVTAIMAVTVRFFDNVTSWVLLWASLLLTIFLNPMTLEISNIEVQPKNSGNLLGTLAFKARFTLSLTPLGLVNGINTEQGLSQNHTEQGDSAITEIKDTGQGLFFSYKV